MKSTKPRKSKPIDWDAYALSGTEDAAQVSLFGWAAQPDIVGMYPDLKFMFAIPNGMYTPYKHIAGKMRAMGMKSGVPDIFLPVRRGEWPGLFIELKREKTDTKAAGKTSKEQDVWIEHLQLQGFGVIVCHGFQHARDTIIQYLNYNVKQPETEKSVETIKKMSDEDLKQFNTGGWK